MRACQLTCCGADTSEAWGSCRECRGSCVGIRGAGLWSVDRGLEEGVCCMGMGPPAGTERVCYRKEEKDKAFDFRGGSKGLQHVAIDVMLKWQLQKETGKTRVTAQACSDMPEWQQESGLVQKPCSASSLPPQQPARQLGQPHAVQGRAAHLSAACWAAHRQLEWGLAAVLCLCLQHVKASSDNA